MALTQMQKDFSNCLMSTMKDTEAIIAVALLLKTREETLEMVSYLKNNKKATDEEIVEKALEIHDKTKQKNIQ